MGKPNRVLNIFRVILVGLGIVSTALLSWLLVNYFVKQSQIIPQYSNTLKTKGLQYASQVTSFVEEQMKIASQMSASPELITQLQTLKQAAREDNQENQDIKQAKQMLVRIGKEFALQTRETVPFTNFMLARADGKIVFSLNQPEYLQVNLAQDSYSRTKLGYSFARTVMSLAPDISEFYFDETIRRPALYISQVIFSDGKIEGVLIVQIDHNYIYQLSHNYLGLGKTGEIVVSEKRDDKALIIVPTRLNPYIAFKRSGLHEPGFKSPLEVALDGAKGVGFGYDYRKKYVLAFWDYLPNLNWGFDVKIDYDEIVNIHRGLKDFLLFMVILTFILWAIVALLFSPSRRFIGHYAQRIRHHVITPIFSIRFSSFCAILSLGIALFFFYQLKHAQDQALHLAKEKAFQLGSEAVKNIEYELNKVSFFEQAMNSYLTESHISKEELLIALKREVSEEPNIFAFCVAYMQHAEKQKDLFAPFVTRKNGAISVFNLHEILQAQGSQSTDLMHQEWFNRAIEEKKGVWIQPFKDYLTGKWVIAYAEPLYEREDKEHRGPIGVTAAFYSVDLILPLLQPLHIGESGYPSIVNKDGKFVYHPLEAFDSQKNLFTESKETDNVALSQIDQNIIAGKAGIESYFGLITNRMMWIAYQPIPKIGWSLILRFVEREISPSAEESHQRSIWIIVFLVAALIFLSNVLIVLFATHTLRAFAIVVSVIFCLGILGVWSLVEPNIDVKNGEVVYNAIGLDAYITELAQDARQRYEPEPVILPTGIFIESWGITGSDRVAITGSIWQKYNDEKHRGLVREFTLPDATSLKITNQYKYRQHDNETVGASIDATIIQQFDFSKFPLDSQRIQIYINHENLEKNVILVPDLVSYESVAPTSLPGLDKQFKQLGYAIKRSFFSLEKMKEETDFGISGYGNISDHIKLNYNIIVVRDLLNAMIVFFLPLLVILISLFAIFAVTGRVGKKGKQTFVSIASYTGLLFALVVLNIALRNQHPAGNVLYLEYFFFYTYLTILVLIVHGALVQAETSEELIDKRITPILKNLFWPVQLGIWFITTVIVFYT